MFCISSQFSVPRCHHQGHRLHVTYALVVDDLDDGGEATGIRALLEEDNAADLDILPVGSTDFRSHREQGIRLWLQDATVS